MGPEDILALYLLAEIERLAASEYYWGSVCYICRQYIYDRVNED